MVRTIGRRTHLLYTTLLFIIIAVLPYLLQQFDRYQLIPLIALREALVTLLFGFCFTYGYFWALSLHAVVFYIGVPLTFVVFALSHYFIVQFGIFPNQHMIAVFFEATSHEVLSFMSPLLLLFVCVGLIASLCAVYWYRSEAADISNPKRVFVAIIFITSMLIWDKAGVSKELPPLNISHLVSEYLQERFGYKASRFDIASLPLHTTRTDLPTVVLLIGESVRSDHIVMNGYHRNTTPMINLHHKAGNLFNFNQVEACSSLTRTSVACLISRASQLNTAPIYKETSIINLFNKLGYKTIWYGVQGSKSFIDAPFMEFAHQADEQYFFNSHLFGDTLKDEVVLPYMQEAIQKQNVPLFIVIHSYGNHWPYNERYTEAFAHFTPTCTKTNLWDDMFRQVSQMQSCHKETERLINSYDNALLYTDYFIDQIIRMLEPRSAMLLYVSDHGELLGEGGKFLHGTGMRKEERQVPMFLWLSKAFKQEGDINVQAIKSKEKVPLRHEHVFHTLLDCVSITGEIINKELSLCH